MTTRRWMMQATLAGLLGLALPLQAWAGEAATVFLVRHAEKQVGPDAPKDPALTEAGAARADRLATILKDVPLTAVYSTDTLRTRSTGQPAAKGHGLEVQLYDHKDPAALAKGLIAKGGSALVVGHSNTVPGLVAALGGAEPPAIDDGEYDRLYVVVTSEAGVVSVSQLRYGAASTK